MRHGCIRLGVTSSVMTAAMLAISPASAINIILNYDNGQSVNPAQDPSATGLQDMFDFAESYYEDIFQDSHANTTITINFWYEDLDWRSVNTWGLHTLVDENNDSGEPWREVEANLRFDNDRTWFIDPTPEDNSEFDMNQTLWRDLTSTQQADFYNNYTAADIPETFEVGFRGTAPASSPANGIADLLSTVLHEVGHSLGLSGSATASTNETNADTDYDFDTAWVFGETLAAEAVPGDIGHLDVDFAMMCGGCAANGLRRMPSHTDLFAMAASNNYDNLDVPRREFYGGTNWNNSANWSGDAVPHFNDDVFVRDPGAVVTANLTANGVANNLTVAEGGNVDTEAFKLDVTATALVTGLNTDLFIRSGGELEAATLDIEDQAEVRPYTGGLIDVNTLNIDGTSDLIGAGTVDVATRLNNDGAITVTSGNLLTFQTTGGAVWNLDGGNLDNPTINAIVGDINFASGTLADAFDGEMNVGVGHYLNFANGWQLGFGGVLTLGGGTLVADRAEVSGNASISGDINVDKFGELDGQVTNNALADITINDTDDRLDLGNSTGDLITYNGGDFTGGGKLVQDGDATVTAGATVNIDVSQFDFDGDTISDTTIEPGATMNITGTGITDAHNGVVTIDSGMLNVDTKLLILNDPLPPIILPQAWTMDGSLVFVDSGTNPVLTGSKLFLNGAISVSLTGTAEIQSAIEFNPGSNTEITSVSDRLILSGTTTFDGGTFTGFGELEQAATANVISNTTIGVSTYDWDGSSGTETTNINDGVTFTINSGVIDNSGDGFDGTINVNGGSLAVNTTAAWGMDGTMNLANGGGGIPAVSGQQMNVGGDIVATGGLSYINAPVSFGSGANVSVDASSELELNGATTYSGGSYTGDGTIQQDGNATVDAATTIGVAEFDLDGTSGLTATTLNDDLTLNVTNIDTGNNNFNGTININSGFAQLTVNTPDPWFLTNTLNITHGVASANTSIAGQDFTLSGTANINAWTGWDARANISGTVNVNGAGNVFSVRGGDAVDTNQLSGGTITGTGRLAVGTSKRLVGYGTISTSQLSLNLGGRLLADDGILTIDSSLISSTLSRIGTNDSDGTLNVVNAWNTSTYQALELNGGSVVGASITNNGLTTGYGLIATAGGFSNGGTLTANGGTLEIDPGGALDLDGAGNTGTINALSGDVLVSKNAGLIGFAGQLNVGVGQSFAMLFGGMDNNGLINLTGGTVDIPSLNHFGAIDVNSAPSIIQAATTFENGSTTVVNDNLVMYGDLLLRPGATVSGSSGLVMSPGTTLHALDGATIEATLQNDGAVVLGSSPGTLVVDDYEQTPGGQIEFELGGLSQGAEFDYMNVSDTALLDGLLDVVLLGGYLPSIGDSYEIIAAGTSLTGTFSNILFPAIPGVGMGISYTASTATLNAGLLGDLNGDGFVGLDDLDIILNNWNAGVDAGVWGMGDPTGDGFVGLDDLDVLLNNWNAGTPPPTIDVANIPEPASVMCLTTGVGLLLRRRCAIR